ncbi:hypothetical protein FA15DRAFT_138106 [Coprinopsis marcescibilis]|uniref:Uncharacterized protein n=1 Tax=Coprinopsis marcescibilis TaxID=230819 RepID=A0A5C3KIW1_COPMA|nr:hypothetical protein FA15DRAFT_138106 [Coprinopsis marcescibilis]
MRRAQFRLDQFERRGFQPYLLGFLHWVPFGFGFGGCVWGWVGIGDSFATSCGGPTPVRGRAFDRGRGRVFCFCFRLPRTSSRCSDRSYILLPSRPVVAPRIIQTRERLPPPASGL